MARLKMRHSLGTRFMPGKNREEKRRNYAEMILLAMKEAALNAAGQQTEQIPDSPYLIDVFEEDSTRTKTSTIVAAMNKGCRVIDLVASKASLTKGETLQATATMFAQYNIWAMAIRTKTEGAGLWLAQESQRIENASKWVYPGFSIIDCGQGTKEHSSQQLLDDTTIIYDQLGAAGYTEIPRIFQEFSKLGHEGMIDRICQILDNISMALVGDARYSRVFRSRVKMGELFDIKFMFVSPIEFRLPKGAMPKNAGESDSLRDALDYDYVYFGRLQLERLTGTPENPKMSEHEALQIVRPFEATLEFVEKCRGKLMHAQPRDAKLPMIPDSLEAHPKVLMLMQSWMGVPARQAIMQICYESRFENAPLINILPVSLTSNYIKRQLSWEENLERLKKKHHGEQVILHVVEDGVVLDHEENHLAMVHYRQLALDGVLGQPDGRQVIPAMKLDTHKFSMNLKAALYLYGYGITPEQASSHGLISPHVHFVLLDKGGKDPNNPGYIQAEFPLPSHTRMFNCMNPECITHRSKAAKTVMEVFGEKGESINGYTDAVLQCVYCEDMFTAQELVEEQFGNFILS